MGQANFLKKSQINIQLPILFISAQMAAVSDVLHPTNFFR